MSFIIIFYGHNFQDFVTMKRESVLFKYYSIILLESQIYRNFQKKQIKMLYLKMISLTNVPLSYIILGI